MPRYGCTEFLPDRLIVRQALVSVLVHEIRGVRGDGLTPNDLAEDWAFPRNVDARQLGKDEQINRRLSELTFQPASHRCRAVAMIGKFAGRYSDDRRSSMTAKVAPSDAGLTSGTKLTAMPWHPIFAWAQHHLDQDLATTSSLPALE